MFKTNEYFGGQVVSLAFANQDGPATVGVMEAGEYEFGTSSTEYMTVVSGSLTVQLPGETEFKTYLPSQTSIVPPNQKFKVKVTEQTAYLCLYKYNFKNTKTPKTLFSGFLITEILTFRELGSFTCFFETVFTALFFTWVTS